MQNRRFPLHRLRPGITGKLFLAILALCAVLALGIGMAARHSFQSGFLEYLVETEEKRISALCLALSEEYALEGSWDKLKDPRQWRRRINSFVRPEQEPPPPPPGFFPNPPGPGRVAALPPRPPMPMGMHPKQERAVDRVRRDWERAYLRSTLGLLEADKATLVAGFSPGPDALWTPVEHEGTIVGWLTHAPLSGITDAVDLKFQEKQRSAYVLITLLTLALAAVFALLMARFLLAPLRRFALTTGQLASGDFSARVSPAPDFDPSLGQPMPTTREGYDELQILAAQLNHLGRVLERNEAARRTFMAEIAHDLRTPLTVLRGEIEAMEDGVRPLSRESLDSLRAEVELLGRLVDDIHTLSLADLGRLRFDKRPLDVRDAVSAAVQAMEERSASAGITLAAEVSAAAVGRLVVLADPFRLSQVLRNVLENSLRYTEPGGRTAIRCFRDNEQAVIEIFDSPPAVPDVELPLLFNRFHTGDPARGRAKGSGLGLAICRSLVEVHGGTITAHPSPLGGVLIRITLPLLEEV